MRHERIGTKEEAGELHVAAVWPQVHEAIALPAAANDAKAQPPFAPTPAAADLPPAVGRLVAASYLGLLSMFFLFMAGSAEALFAITISAGFMAIFFAVPRLFLHVEPRTGRRPSFARFMAGGMETLTGHASGRDALIQMMIVPVFLTFGIAAMGIAGWVFIR
jgi:hypothetical protein